VLARKFLNFFYNFKKIDMCQTNFVSYDKYSVI